MVSVGKRREGLGRRRVDARVGVNAGSHWRMVESVRPGLRLDYSEDYAGVRREVVRVRVLETQRNNASEI